MNPAISLEQLYDRYAHLVLRRCLMILGNQADAEDALQETYIKAMKALDSFRGDSSPMTWLYRIATNVCLNRIRSHKRLRKRLEQQATQHEIIQPSFGEDIEAWTAVRQLLPHFDRRSQELAVACFVDGMNQQELAEAFGLSVPTVRKYLNKFIEQARKRLNR
jgi:RNA polymerase sigma-70 factor (ECF subfamily)